MRFRAILAYDIGQTILYVEISLAFAYLKQNNDDQKNKSIRLFIKHCHSMSSSSIIESKSI